MVLTATDVAKAAAGMVLTQPGLAGIVAAVREGRVTFQRVQTYALNSILKKVVSVLFLVAGLAMTGQAVLAPLLMMIVMITGDVLGMALTTDRVVASGTPNAWRIGRLILAGVVLGACLLAFLSAVLAVGAFGLRLETGALQSLAFMSLVFGGQAAIYAIRGRRHVWGLRPSRWVLASSAADVAISSGLAIGGVAMTPLPALLVGSLLAATVAFAFVLALVKVPVFTRLGVV